MSIKFFLYRTDLLEALHYLAPFIVPQKKSKCDDEPEEDEPITIPKPYFADKVTCSFQNDKLKLYVLVDDITIERNIPVIIGHDNISFCLPFAYLLQEVERCDCKVFKFVEDRFFGFMVYDSQKESHIFDVEACSARLQKLPTSINPDSPVFNSIKIERSILYDVLSVFPKYTLHSPLAEKKGFNHIWCTISDGVFTAFATTDAVLLQKKYDTSVTRSYRFAIPGFYATRFLDIINKWPDDQYQCIEYSPSTCRIRNNDDGIVFSFPNVYPSDIEKVLAVDTVSLTARMLIDDLRSTLQMKKDMQCTSEPMVLHFLYDHVNIYCKDSSGEHKMFEFKDVDICEQDCVVCVNSKLFESLLDDINYESVMLCLMGKHLLHITDEEEYALGGTTRILATSKLSDETEKLLTEGDATLQSHPKYIEMYNNNDYASIDEMRSEAIARMKHISLYQYIIEAFEEDGQPQVYEPPYGASYSLEDDELEAVHTFEKQRNILIWGVIRSFMNVGGEQTTIDHYLFVSHDKTEWETERKDLYECNPFVYTTAKEYPMTDSGHISIYMSPGGTPLRDM